MAKSIPSTALSSHTTTHPHTDTVTVQPYSNILHKCCRKWDCYLEEVEGYEVQTVVSVPEELQETVNPCHVNAISTPGLGYRNQWRWRRRGEGGPSSIIFKFSFLLPGLTMMISIEHAIVVDRHVG